MSRPVVGVFRPDDGRLEDAVELLKELGAEPVADPLLAVEPTGAAPRGDADYLVMTSGAGVRLLPDGFDPGAATVCAIGATTAEALRAAGIGVDIVPETYSSAGLLKALDGRVDGARVEIARSDHGSAVLPEGLAELGAYHHETVLYQLCRPPESGESVELAAAGHLDAALFTSSLTVDHFVEVAEERGVGPGAVAGLNAAVVGAIGEPTSQRAAARDIEIDVVPETASFEALARAVAARLGLT